MRSYISIEVRYAETDQMGVVHHSVYPVWFETARTRFSQEMGVPYQEMERMGLMLPVRELSVKYVAPAVYGGNQGSPPHPVQNRVPVSGTERRKALGGGGDAPRLGGEGFPSNQPAQGVPHSL